MKRKTGVSDLKEIAENIDGISSAVSGLSTGLDDLCTTLKYQAESQERWFELFVDELKRIRNVMEEDEEDEASKKKKKQKLQNRKIAKFKESFS